MMDHVFSLKKTLPLHRKWKSRVVETILLEFYRRMQNKDSHSALNSVLEIDFTIRV